MRPLGQFAAVVGCIVSLWVSPVLGYGSETEPNLVDPEGDVEYALPALEEHPHIDILKVWVHAANNTTLEIVLHTVDNGSLDDAEQWEISCTIRLAFEHNDEETGEMALSYSVSPQAAEPSSSVRWDGTGASGSEQISHEFQMESGRPGEGRFTVGAGDFYSYGSRIGSVQAVCDENLRAGPAIVQGTDNEDTAISTDGFDIARPRQGEGPDAEHQPEKPANSPTAGKSVPGPLEEARDSPWGFSSPLLVAVMMVLVHRLRPKRVP